jgi:hypothetical protein
MDRLRQAMSQECRCQEASPHEHHHLANIAWQVGKILDHSGRAFVALLAGNFVQALRRASVRFWLAEI